MVRIAVAMSGGVDSSVAAALSVKKYGKDNVFGVTMRLFCDEKECHDTAIHDAKSVCEQLGISHEVVDLQKEFQSFVIDSFVAEYAKGKTPNPCVECNKRIKFGSLLKEARSLGADKLVTGHYARIEHTSLRGSKTKQSPLITLGLYRGIDILKDQSYFLYNLTQEQLRSVWFPLGDKTKTEVRTLARRYGLKTAEKDESQDICFIDGSVQGFLNNKITQKSGLIVDRAGKKLGKHSGLADYTIGQRRGLGGGFSDIMYVIGLDFGKNEVIIGQEKALYGDTLVVASPHWVNIAPGLPFKCLAKIRYASEPVECTITAVIPAKAGIQKKPDVGLDSSLRWNDEDSIAVTFSVPQKAITPGQSVVFYNGDEVIGGGVITKADKS